MAAAEKSGSLDATAKAIELLARHGYESTSVAELADAAGVSRSTFFRRFGSKEDIVFADHDYLLKRVETELREHAGDPFEAVCAGVRLVLAYHLRRPEVSRYRYELLQRNPVLRDRELVASSRYERAFTSYLRAAFPETAERDWVLVAFSASAVSLHNLALRSWLRGRADDPAAELLAELSDLSKAFLALFRQPVSRHSDESGQRRVVVAVVEPNKTTSQVLIDIARSLNSNTESSIR